MKSHSIFKRSRACFAVQNLSATTVTAVPLLTVGISNISATPGMLRASLSSTDFGDAPKVGGCATSATFIPGRSRSSPNFREPLHLGRLSSRRVFLPTSRKSPEFLSGTVSGTVMCAAASARSAYVADRPPGPRTTLASVRHSLARTFHWSAAAAISMARVLAPSSRYC